MILVLLLALWVSRSWKSSRSRRAGIANLQENRNNDSKNRNKPLPTLPRHLLKEIRTRFRENLPYEHSDLFSQAQQMTGRVHPQIVNTTPQKTLFMRRSYRETDLFKHFLVLGVRL